MAKKQKNKKTKNSKYIALTLAVAALVVNFWAWSLLSPLGTVYANEFSLSSIQLSLLLAVPVLVGSLGRIIFGIITDKIGGRRAFTLICLVCAVPVFGLMMANTYHQLLLIAFLLGVGGAAFVVGIPFVGAWFPPERRGLVLGIYSMGNAGTALSGFATPRLADYLGRDITFLIVGLLLVFMAVLFLIIGQNAPGWKPPKTSSLSSLKKAMKFQVTWDLSAVYIITFGAFVAFGVYLPVLLKTTYNLSLTDAATKAAGFVLLATIARPVGGWLSDKIGGRLVIKASLLGVIILACFVAFQSTLGVKATIVYLSLAFILGCSNGAVFALVGRSVSADIMGSVTGVIGAVGGLGGFLPPLVLGLTYQKTHSYAPALIMLAISAFVVLVYVNWRFRDKVLYHRCI